MNIEKEPDFLIPILPEDIAEEKRLLEEKIEVLEISDYLLLESHNVVVTEVDKSIISERSFGLFQLMYEYTGGFYSYRSFREMAKTAELIKFTYDGPLNDPKDFEVEKCMAIATYNKKCGLKMTGMAANYVCYKSDVAKAAMRKLQRESFKFSWGEYSDKGEKFAIECGGLDYQIAPTIIKEKVYPDREVKIFDDDKHYSRALTDSGKIIIKRAMGTIKI